ncbi:helix-turn-helix domain-containing protein [Cupriavidus sp. SW-Y-13]|nr:helix-turn-helix domain-containing protein [Cupriavidus sp. SW-Y-13]
MTANAKRFAGGFKPVWHNQLLADFPLIFLTEPQAAVVLGVKPSTLERWRYASKGPSYVKIGGGVRYRPNDLSAWADANTVIPLQKRIS